MYRVAVILAGLFLYLPDEARGDWYPAKIESIDGEDVWISSRPKAQKKTKKPVVRRRLNYRKRAARPRYVKPDNPRRLRKRESSQIASRRRLKRTPPLPTKRPSRNLPSLQVASMAGKNALGGPLLDARQKPYDITSRINPPLTTRRPDLASSPVRLAALDPGEAIRLEPVTPRARSTPKKWLITRRAWNQNDERKFEEFVRLIGESDCNNFHECLHSARSNPRFHNSHPKTMIFTTDCADFPYMLRGYYAWQSGLPFSYSSRYASHPRPTGHYTTRWGNQIVERREVLGPSPNPRLEIQRIG